MARRVDDANADADNNVSDDNTFSDDDSIFSEDFSKATKNRGRGGEEVEEGEEEDRPWVCPRSCGRAFKRKDHLASHILKVHGEKKFQCSFEDCKVAFVTEKQLNRHQLTHSHPNPYICQICSKSFPKKTKLRAHRLESHQISEFTCMFDGCFKLFPSQSKLERHQNTHKNRFVCLEPNCFHVMNNYFEFRKHKAFAHKTSSSSSSASSTSSQLLNPSEMIDDDDDIWNDFCEDDDQSKSDTESGNMESQLTPTDDLKQSLKRKHEVSSSIGENSPKSFTCEEANCHRTFTKERNLRAHIKAVHSDPASREFVCPYADCERRFGWKAVLQRHVQRIHIDGKKPRNPTKPYQMRGLSCGSCDSGGSSLADECNFFANPFFDSNLEESIVEGKQC